MRFLTAFLVPHAALAVATVALNHGSYSRADVVAYLSILVGIPFAAAWAAFELLTRLRPLRHFHPRAKAWRPRMAAGAAAGVSSVSLSAMVVALFPNPPSDPYVFALGGALAVAATLRLLPRYVRGSCPSCGYDLTHTPQRCPECGTTQIPARFQVPS
ncbi:MAG: hypothetical protein WAZ94_07840 [Phycisphaerales bacterium]